MFIHSDVKRSCGGHIYCALIFGLFLLITITAATNSVPVTPTGIFTQYPDPLQQQDTNQSSSAAYDDFDNYLPFRSDQHDQFSWNLLKEILLQEQHKNVIISPFSVKLIIALLAEATGNNTQTQKELFSTMTDIRSPDNFREYYKKVLPALKKENPYYTLNLETKIFADSFIEAQQKYAAMLESHYDTSIQNLDFANSRASANIINKWCSNVTNGNLKELVNEQNIQNNVMLMANVIYFNGLWRRKFNYTFPNVFFKTPDVQIKAVYMEQTEYFYYHDSEILDAKILRLPYKGKKFSMFILLPKTLGGIDELTRDLENDQLKRMQFMMDDVKVKVTLPKFKFDFDKNLKEVLKTLGIKEIFTANASLPGLARGNAVARQLKVSNIFQKAGIDVNENGTEAYASTVVEIENKFGGSSTIEEFYVNRPFIFFIEEEATGNILFAGKVTEPFI